MAFRYNALAQVPPNISKGMQVCDNGNVLDMLFGFRGVYHVVYERSESGAWTASFERELHGYEEDNLGGSVRTQGKTLLEVRNRMQRAIDLAENTPQKKRRTALLALGAEWKQGRRVARKGSRRGKVRR